MMLQLAQWDKQHNLSSWDPVFGRFLLNQSYSATVPLSISLFSVLPPHVHTCTHTHTHTAHSSFSPILRVRAGQHQLG